MARKAMAQQQPYGSWASPISAGLVAEAVDRLGWPALDGGRVYWHEQRPRQQGRGVVCSAGPDGVVVEHTPGDHNVRTLVHEYGGLAYVVREGTVWYCNFDDQRVWCRSPDGTTTPVTREPSTPRSERYADLHIAPDATWLAAVRERHLDGVVHNEIVAVPADGDGDPTVLVSGNDFYAAPRISPDGTTLAWLSWDHPAMPWDHTVLSTAALDDGRVGATRVVVGDAGAVFQPAWSPGGLLHFVADTDGWWNLYRMTADGAAEQLTREEAELGLPLWFLGEATYAFLDGDRIACLVNRDAALRLHVLDTTSGRLDRTPLTGLLCDAPLAAADGEIAVVGGTETSLPQVRRWRPGDDGDRVVAGAADVGVPPGHLSRPQHVSITDEEARPVHAVLWPPTNPDVVAPDRPPPLLVDVHGGPTGQVMRDLRLERQFWTSRGFAVVAPNYGGSTGYGRAYRERLKGAWGVVDVADSVRVARWLVDNGHADGDRVAIRGGSAGGYTTLVALTEHDDFTAGVSRFGVSDLRLLAAETHKFESRYVDGLVGGDPRAWSERAPITHVHAITAPLLLLQGEEDQIVPPSQAERLVEGLEATGTPYAYVTFPGEQHGFRRGASIRRALEVELAFYAHVWGFEPADGSAPLEVRGRG
jgi:dipeptidyl aminopeptidase/acylaminoacyl peptidase